MGQEHRPPAGHRPGGIRSAGRAIVIALTMSLWLTNPAAAPVGATTPVAAQSVKVAASAAAEPLLPKTDADDAAGGLLPSGVALLLAALAVALWLGGRGNRD